ncbi:hypothetical protein [Curtobacterium sp. MCSS17_007]|uniref:hypothetical protein n=1 Tax=Curtobacterium sp. MCSS17_007 TaxID=2175646 RepID=UPI000DA9D736|nr:hypothetical protein [Curtobacterium sp. MCSS17_007]WIE76780.1 hypothetical protein DEJ22_005840 [Curtobacterium sp. MCSS17_007]
MIAVDVPTLPRVGPLPTLRLYARPTTLDAAAAVAVAYADDVRTDSAVTRADVADIAMRALLYNAGPAQAGPSPLAFADLRALMARDPSADDRLRAALAR